MLKRLIEVALPLKEVSAQSAREKSIRHGHISTLHIWWARRPLAACRAAVFASLIPDPDDPECPPQFRTLVRDVLGRGEFTPKNGDGSTVEDTPRNRCLEFIKQLVKWENSNKPEYIEPARNLIAAAHKFLHPDSDAAAPKVLDPFAGGGAIPLEALRLGCESHAIDLNPVAHLIELCTLVYPQKYGQPDSRPVPDYIKRLAAHNRAKKKVKGESSLFEKEGGSVAVAEDEIIPDVEITEAEYRKNPLAADVKYWGLCMLERARQSVGELYDEPLRSARSAAFLWARTITCSNPECRLAVPLLNQLWICKTKRRRLAIRIVPDSRTKACTFELAEGDAIDFSPDVGTVRKGNASCPSCKQTSTSDYVRKECRSGRVGQQLMLVVTTSSGKRTKQYRVADAEDLKRYQRASEQLTILEGTSDGANIPDEAISTRQPRLMWATLYGLQRWRDIFNARQLLTIAILQRQLKDLLGSTDHIAECEYRNALRSVLALVLDWFIEKSTTLTRWHTSGEKISGTYGRQGLPFVWDYAEVSPFSGVGADFRAGVIWAQKVLVGLAPTRRPAYVQHGSATAISITDGILALVATDPPYYDAVPYSDLSDLFYVWLKRAVADIHRDAFRTPVTPKRQELIEERAHTSLTDRKDRTFYESGMADAFKEVRRVLSDDGICAVMFAHKTTSAWETLISSLLRAGLTVTSSWPFHTEMKARMIAQGTASLASSVTLVCRKRESAWANGLWDDVRSGLQEIAHERLDFFWSQGIRGADFFISAIGPALSVFGKYEKVTKLSGEEVTVGQFLDEVRGLVTNYALAKIATTKDTKNTKGGKGAGLGQLDAETKFYVMWKWSYGDSKAPADESFKLAQALGISTETIWDRSGVLERSGENVQALTVAKRMKIKDLGDPTATGAPASLIDVLHRMCVYRDKGDTGGLAEFLARSGQGGNPSLWLVAQAISEILPDGDKEKQLMQGLLNQKEQLEEAQGRLF